MNVEKFKSENIIATADRLNDITIYIDSSLNELNRRIDFIEDDLQCLRNKLEELFDELRTNGHIQEI